MLVVSVAAAGDDDVHTDEIPSCDGLVDGFLGSVLLNETGLVVVDVLLGDVPDRTIDFQPLVGWQVERRADFDFEFVFEILVIRNIDGLEIDVRLVDRVDIALFSDLIERDHQHALLDLLRDFLLETLLDQIGRNATRAKSGNLGLVRVFIDRGRYDTRDGVLRHRDADVLLARTNVLDLSLQIEAWLNRDFRLRLVEHLLFRHVHRSRSIRQLQLWP